MRTRSTWNLKEIAARASATDDDARLKKAELAVAVAKLMLPDGEFAFVADSAKAIEDQAVALLHMPHDDLLATHARLQPRVEEYPAHYVNLLDRIETLEARLDDYED